MPADRDRPDTPPHAADKDELERQRRETARRALDDRFTVRGSEYRYRSNPGVVALRDEGKRLSTTSDRPLVAQSVVEVAQAKGWRAFRVSGTDEFKREVWREASLRGIKVVGYSPSREDRAALEAVLLARGRTEQAGFDRKKLQPTRDASRPAEHSPAVAVLERFLAGHRKDISPELRARMVAVGAEKAANLERAGTPKVVKVFDPRADRAMPRPTPNLAHVHERSSRSR